MDFVSWFTDLFKESAPEPLVFGAELKCSYGSKHNFLLLVNDDIEINGLSKACVDDCEAFINIRPFGTCSDGSACKDCMVLEKQWENPEPQNEIVNGKEIITTKSYLMCKAKGGVIEAETSGQEQGELFTRSLMLCSEMEEKYPGLFDLLIDPDASLYLEEGMYERAIRFLEDELEKNGGEISIQSLYNEYEPKWEMVKAALGHLMPECNVKSINAFMDGLETKGAEYGMCSVAGWSVNTLNAAMMEMIKKDCKATVDHIQESSMAKWLEGHKKGINIAGDISIFAAYVAVGAVSMARWAGIAQPRALSGEWKPINESMSDFSRAYQKQITGKEGVVWEQNGVKFDGMKDGVLLDAKGKYAQFINKNTGEFYDWFSGKESLVNQAMRQINASEGAKIQWYFAEEETLNAVQDLFMERGIKGIELIFEALK